MTPLERAAEALTTWRTGAPVEHLLGKRSDENAARVCILAYLDAVIEEHREDESLTYNVFHVERWKVAQ